MCVCFAMHVCVFCHATRCVCFAMHACVCFAMQHDVCVSPCMCVCFAMQHYVCVFRHACVCVFRHATRCVCVSPCMHVCVSPCNTMCVCFAMQHDACAVPSYLQDGQPPYAAHTQHTAGEGVGGQKPSRLFWKPHHKGHGIVKVNCFPQSRAKTRCVAHPGAAAHSRKCWGCCCGVGPPSLHPQGHARQGRLTPLSVRRTLAGLRPWTLVAGGGWRTCRNQAPQAEQRRARPCCGCGTAAARKGLAARPKAPLKMQMWTGFTGHGQGMHVWSIVCFEGGGGEWQSTTVACMGGV